jgi:hypothetical protein
LGKFERSRQNENLDLEFADWSLKESFNTSADYVARGMTAQIKLASITVCLYGPTTYTSMRVEWELRKSLELGKPIMGVCLYSDGRVRYYPAPLEDKPRVNWNVREIVRVMRQIVR